MKAQFVKSLIKTMVQDHNFLLLKERDGQLQIGAVHNILVKEDQGRTIFIELLDGDVLSPAEIGARLQQRRRFLADHRDPNGFCFLEVFIFQSDPDQDRLAPLVIEEFPNQSDKTFLNCLTVNLENKSIQRHFNTSLTDFGLTQTISRILATGLDSQITDAELIELISKKEQEYRSKLQPGKPVITYILIGINVLIWLLLSLYSKVSGFSYDQLLITFGAKENLQILSGEFWRFLTPVFLHANLFHLLINCFSLNAAGSLVEKIFGRLRFGVVYLCAGIMGNILSFCFAINPGVGASGSIFGLMGALLYFGILRPSLFKSHFGNNIILTILLNLGYGFTNAGIDNFAHIGGLIGGFLASGIVLPADQKRWYTNRLFYLCLTLILVFSGLLYGFNNTQNKVLVKINELEQLDQAGSWVKAEVKAEEILHLKPGNKGVQVYTLWTLAKAQAMSGKYSEALITAEQLTTIAPAKGHYLQGLFYFNMREYDLAREELTQAKNAGAKYETIDKLLGEIGRLGK